MTINVKNAEDQWTLADAEMAKKVLTETLMVPWDNLPGRAGYNIVRHTPGESTAYLDGDFTASELLYIAKLLANRLGQT